MCDLNLDSFTSDWKLEEQGYQDPVIRNLAESIEHTERALSALNQGGSDVEARDTHRATLQSVCVLYAAVEYRLATLAVEMGKDPEEVLYHA
jgi:hypothetical protein